MRDFWIGFRQGLAKMGAVLCWPFLWPFERRTLPDYWREIDGWFV